MSKEMFYSLAFITFGFSIGPFILFSVLYLVGRIKYSYLPFWISLLEFINGSSNILFYLFGYGNNKWQFNIYFILEIVVWLLIISKYFISKKISAFIFVLITTFIVLLFSVNEMQYLGMISKIIQFSLGLLLILDSLKINRNQKDFKNSKYISIGLMLYGFSTFNLYLLRNIVIKMDDFSFYLSWTTHQFAAIIYFSLLSISIWKSQKI